MRPSCRRVIRDVLEFFRFGDLDAGSAPHLDHLAVCVECRDEVGLDRELVLHLQRTLRARVDGHAPSSGAWVEIRRRVLQPEVPTWRSRLVPVLRLAPMGATLVLLLALLAPASLSPFRMGPWLAEREPSILQVQPGPDPDSVDPYGGRWWIALVPAPPVTAPETGPVPAADPWERQAVAVAPRTGPTR